MPYKNKSKGLTPEQQEMYDREMDPKLYGEFDFDNSIGVSDLKDKDMMRKEVAKIGWEGVRKRLTSEYGQDLNKGMDYHPPKKDLVD